MLVTPKASVQVRPGAESTIIALFQPADAPTGTVYVYDRNFMAPDVFFQRSSSFVDIPDVRGLGIMFGGDRLQDQNARFPNPDGGIVPPLLNFFSDAPFPNTFSTTMRVRTVLGVETVYGAGRPTPYQVGIFAVIHPGSYIILGAAPSQVGGTVNSIVPLLDFLRGGSPLAAEVRAGLSTTLNFRPEDYLM